MDFSELGKMVTKFGAPILGTLLGGAPGAAIGQLIANEFGGDANDPDDLAKRIAGNPEAEVKLREIQSREKVELQRLLFASESNRLATETQKTLNANENTENARQYNLRSNSIIPEFLSLIIVVGFFAIIYWIAAYPQDNSDHDVLNVLFGIISTAFATVVKHWLGN